MDLILNVYKESGYTSFKVVRFLRQKFNTRKIGYIGTLDPFATGVLPVFIGNFTKLIPYIKNHRKIYRFNIQFGIKTDTLDITGELIEENKKELNLNKKLISKIIEEFFLGKTRQIPPVYSAIKINGKRAYKMARENKDINMPEREVEMFSYEIEEIYENGFIGTIETSSGFYVRSFARDIGEKLNTVSTLVQLERIRSGDFVIDNAIRKDDIREENAVNIIELMNNYMIIRYSDETEIEKLKMGQSIIIDKLTNGTYMFVSRDMQNIVICECENEIINTKRVIK